MTEKDDLTDKQKKIGNYLMDKSDIVDDFTWGEVIELGIEAYDLAYNEVCSLLDDLIKDYEENKAFFIKCNQLRNAEKIRERIKAIKTVKTCVGGLSEEV